MCCNGAIEQTREAVSVSSKEKNCPKESYVHTKAIYVYIPNGKQWDLNNLKLPDVPDRFSLKKKDVNKPEFLTSISLA